MLKPKKKKSVSVVPKNIVIVRNHQIVDLDQHRKNIDKRLYHNSDAVIKNRIRSRNYYWKHKAEKEK